MDEIDHIRRILERERLARKEAERILESKSLELFEKRLEVESLQLSIQKKSAEELEKLSRKQRLLNKLFETHPLPIVIISVNTSKVLEANQEGMDFLGLKKDDIGKIHIRDLCDQNQIEEREFCQSENSLDWLKTITRMKNFEGVIFDVEITLIESEFNRSPSLVLMIEDRSEQVALKKQSEEQLKLLSLFPELNPNPVFRYQIDQKELLYSNTSGTEFLVALKAEFTREHYQKWEQFLSGKLGSFCEFTWNDKSYGFNRVSLDDYGFINIYSSDITMIKMLEQQNNVQQKKYQNLIEKSSDIIYTIDREGFFTYMNPTGLETLGYIEEEIKTINFRTLLKDSFRDRVSNFYLYQLQSKTKTTYTEFPILSKAGKEHWLGQNVDMSFDGADVNISVVARDVTEKKRLEKENLRSEEKYRLLINNLQLGLVEVDKDGIIQLAHPSFCKMVGYSKQEIEGTTGEFMLDEEAANIMADERRKRVKGTPGLYEMQLTTKSGEKIWLMISGAPTYDEKNKLSGSIGIHLNITESKKLEEELRAAARLAEDSLKTKELFLANISHEMRTPLNGIIGLSELLHEDISLAPDLKAKTESILLSSKNLLNLIDDLLLLTKIENNKIELNPDFNELSASIESLMKAHEVATSNKKIKLINNNDIPKDNSYFIDLYRLHQILNNLLSNAIKFTHEGSVTLNSRVTYQTKNFDVVEFEIIDTGMGIPDDEIDEIFGSFQQASNNDIRQNGGTGLGLSIVKQMTELMGGDLDLQTSQKGTKFILEFQLDKSKITKKKAPVALPEKNELRDLKILVAEDNRINQQVIRNMLEKLPVDFDICSTGKQAVENFNAKSYDIILMDLRMPEMDGIEATEVIRKTDKNIAIIAATANTTIVNKNDYLDKGFTDLLSKPFTQNDLIEILKKHTQESSFSILNNLLNITNEDVHFSKELALIFIEDSTIRRDEIQESLRKKDLNTINSLCHSMKPSLLQLGNKEIQRLVLELENEESWTDRTSNKVSIFIEKLNEMISEMEHKVVPKLDNLSQI